MHIENLTINMLSPSALTAAALAAIMRLPDAADEAERAIDTAIQKIGEAWTAQGGIYAGIARGEDGLADHHLILLSDKPSGRLKWQAAMDWAKTVGGELPTRSESALLYAHLRDQFDTSAYHWTATQCSADCAFYQAFSGGGQSYYGQLGELLARAVRRLEL